MRPRPVAASVDALVAGASSRIADGVRRLEVGRPLRTGRDRRRAVRAQARRSTATTGSCARPATSAASRCGSGSPASSTSLPACIDHATVGAAREDGHGAVLMRDVGEWLVPAGDAPIDRRAAPPVPRPPRRAARGVAGDGATTSACVPVATATRSSDPSALACEAALGFPQPVPAHRDRGLAAPRRRVPRSSPTRSGPLRRRAVAAVRRARRDTERAPPRRHQVRQPRHRCPTAARSCVDWSHDRRGPAARPRSRTQLALNRARIPPELRDATRPSTPTAPRSSATASTPRRGSNVSSSLCLSA